MNARFVVTTSDPFMVTCLSKKNPMGSVLHTVAGLNFPQVVHPLDRNKETCCYVETNQFGGPVKTCYNKVYMGRSGFLCKMHNDLDIKLKPQFRTIHWDDSQDGGVGRLMKRVQVEVNAERAVPSYPFDYSKYVQWGWARQPLSFIEDGHGNIEQTFSEEYDDSDY